MSKQDTVTLVPAALPDGLRVDRLLMLADAIEQGTVVWEGRPMLFGMERWFSDQGSCGTVGCLAGCAVAMFHPPVQAREALRVVDDWDADPSDWADVMIETAREILGLDKKRAVDLFYPSYSDTRVGDGNNFFLWEAFNATPQQGAEVLRHLAMTGEVDWRRAYHQHPSEQQP